MALNNDKEHEMLNAQEIQHTHEESMTEAEHTALHAHGGHGHTHSHEHTRAVLNRMARSIGHMQAVKRMIEEGRDCADVLLQIAAIRSEIDNTGKLILQDHLKHCIVDAVQDGDNDAIDSLCIAIEKYMK